VWDDANRLGQIDSRNGSLKNPAKPTGLNGKLSGFMSEMLVYSLGSESYGN